MTDQGAQGFLARMRQIASVMWGMVRITSRTLIVPIAPAGWPFVAAAAALAALLAIVWPVAGVLGCLCAVWVLYFFRDPVRVVPARGGLIVAPADGRITHVERVQWPEDSGLSDVEGWRVSIFLSLFNVHIQRVPLCGHVEKIVHVAGACHNAGCDVSARKNAHCLTVLRCENNLPCLVVQRTGLAARRIVNDLKEGQDVSVGSRLGLIKFGSRVDLYFPAHLPPLVCVGQTAIGGETIMADLHHDSGEGDAPEPMKGTPL